MSESIVAVAGTLLGGLLQYAITAFGDRRATAERRRQALVDAVPTLLGALTDHRRHQYLKIVARREGSPDTVEAREQRYAARSAATKAMAALQMATQDRTLLDLARRAVDASFALGDAPDDNVQAAGDTARTAHDAFQEAAARLVYEQR